MIGHILERFLIHFFSAAGVYLVVYFMMQWVRRRWFAWYEIVIPAVLIIGFLGWNEVGDLREGQPFIKAFTDAASWVLGLGVSIWGLVRFRSE